MILSSFSVFLCPTVCQHTMCHNFHPSMHQTHNNDNSYNHRTPSNTVCFSFCMVHFSVWPEIDSRYPVQLRLRQCFFVLFLISLSVRPIESHKVILVQSSMSISRLQTVNVLKCICTRNDAVVNKTIRNFSVNNNY